MEPSSQIIRTAKYLMLQVEKILRLPMSKFGRRMEHQLRDGRLSTRTTWAMKLTRPRDLTKTSVSE
jgi:hypothetical protein